MQSSVERMEKLVGETHHRRGPARGAGAKEKKKPKIEEENEEEVLSAAEEARWRREREEEMKRVVEDWRSTDSMRCVGMGMAEQAAASTCLSSMVCDSFFAFVVLQLA